MANVVEKVLAEAAEKESNYQSTDVKKAIDLEIDAGNLLAVDTNPLEFREHKKRKDEFLQSLSRDNTQLLLNKLFVLPTHRIDDVIVADLPGPEFRIPREKPAPKAKAVSKWQQFANTKGIQNRKKTRKVWDEQKQEYRPRWGYDRANDNTKDWVIEVPENGDPYEDQFEKRKKAKNERVAKNELQRLRNMAKAQKLNLPNTGITPSQNPSKIQVTKALSVAKRSTASIGRFTGNLPKEKPAKNTGKKRKFEPNYGNMKSETARQLKILEGITNKRPIVDSTKAIQSQDRSRGSKRPGEQKSGKMNKTFKPKGKSGGKGHQMKGGKGHSMKGGQNKKGGGSKMGKKR